MELIKVSEQNGKQAVSARELYQFLEASERFSNWIERQFQYGFIENLDYVGCKVFNTLANQELADYALTIDCAKQIAMLQKNDKGKQARQYFIEVEKKYKSETLPMSQFDYMQMSLNILREQAEKQKQLEKRIEVIESKPEINGEIQHFSIMGYCRNIGKQISLEEAKTYGQKCSRMCTELGFQTGKVPDPRFGTVKTYPLSVLESVIE